MTDLVSCRECKKFTPDKVGDGFGIGICNEFAEYKSKSPSKESLRKALLILGNRDGNELFWGGVMRDRHCERFEA